VIAHSRELEEGNLEPGLQWRPFSVDAIKMPVDLGAVVKIVIAQQSEMMASDIIGLVEDFQSLGRQVRTQEVGTFLRPAVTEEEFRLTRRRMVELNYRRWYAYPIKKEVAPLMDFLRHSRANFIPVHPGQARQLVLPFRRHRFPYLTFWPQRDFHDLAPVSENPSL
jgi:hypothetical protein